MPPLVPTLSALFPCVYNIILSLTYHSNQPTLQVQRALRTYSTGEYVATKEKFKDIKYGKTTRKIIGLLQTQDYQTWNLVFTQLARIGEDVKKRSKKARGAPQVAVEDDSDGELEVLPSNVQA